MRQGRTARLALGFFSVASGSGFVPFAGIEELKPRPLHDFCSDEVLEHREGLGALRRCQHSFKSRLEDDSDIELHWSMDVDPDSILSLDTEAEHGVRLAHCADDELVLELPEEHVHHAAEGKLVVGSRFSHSCAHRLDSQIVHRVTKVHSQEWRGGPKGTVAFVRLGTQELLNLAHAVPSYNFYFSWMPSEARDEGGFPEMKTDFGLNKAFLQARRLEGEATARRLFFKMPSFGSAIKKKVESGIDSVDKEDGGFQSGGNTYGKVNTQDGILNLMPKQISNFGWNWDFFMNTTAQPNFELNVPGARGRMKIRKPYIKVHSGIYLNFSSQFKGLTTAPMVTWTAGIKGHGRCNARVIGSLNTTRDAGTDPFFAFKLPIFQELEKPKWFEKVDFATGNLPISMSPGFQMSAQMYHKGAFQGGLGFGIKTQGIMNPSLSYNSIRGFDINVPGRLENTTITPPLWMIFTKHFEMGVMLKPSLLMRGDFAGLEKATMAIQMRPYANITITREGSQGTSTSDMNTLTVYPMRIMGLPDASLQKKYKVRVTVMGKNLETTPQVNFGQVEFRDHITKFDCGQIPQKVLMNPSQTQIQITVLEVDGTQAGLPDVEVGTGQARCTSLLNGECQPSPGTVSIVSAAGQAVAAVQLAIIWQARPDPWFAAQIRGLAFSFPQVILRQSTLTASFPNAVKPGESNPQLSMHLIHGGQTYVISLIGTIGEEQSSLSGDTTIEFGPGFTDTWLPCPAYIPKCEAPRLELYAGEVQIGIAEVPRLEFSSQTAMQGTQGGGFLAAGSDEMNVPSTIAITAPGSSSSTVALATMNSKVVMTLASSMVLQPRAPTQIASGGNQDLLWTISNVDTDKQYEFTLAAYRLTGVAASSMQAYVNFRQVNGQVLMPIKETIQKATSKCTRRGSPTMSAASAPCSFATNFKMAVDAGNRVVVMIAWAEGGSNHQMYTAPFEVLPSGRRLNASCSDESCAAPEPPARRLFNADSWNERVRTHQKACNQRDLKFNFGMGMLMRGKIEGISVPKGFPMIGGLSEQPELTTGFREIGAVHPGEEVNEAAGGHSSLPCQLGLCSGALPGCSQVSNDRKNVKQAKLVFNLSRPYHFDQQGKGKFQGLIKEVLAYAFSTLPEMVDVAIKEMKDGAPWLPKDKDSGGFGMPGVPNTPHWFTSQAPVDPQNPGIQWPSAPPTRQVTPAPAPVYRPKPAPAPPPTMPPAPPPSPASKDVSDAFNKWWSGAAGRRLTSQVGDRELLPDQLADHQVRLEFQQGVPFVIDRPLVEVMLQNGYFEGLDDVEDDHYDEKGPLRITGFYVDSGIPLETDDRDQGESWLEGGMPPPGRTVSLLSLAAASTAGVGMLALAAMARSRKAQVPAPVRTYSFSEAAE